MIYSSLIAFVAAAHVGAPLSADAPAAGRPFPGGVVANDSAVAYVTQPGGGLAAVDLESGKVSWATKDADRPVALIGNRLVALAAGKGKKNELRVVVLDAAEKGKLLEELDPIAFPEWANARGGRDAVEGPGGFDASARLDRGNLVVKWHAFARYYGGVAPTPEMLRRATKDASGEANVDLESGKVATKLFDEAPAPAAPPKLADDVAAVATRQGWSNADVAAVGPRAYGRVWKQVAGAGFARRSVQLLQAVDLKAGKVAWEVEIDDKVMLPPPP